MTQYTTCLNSTATGLFSLCLYGNCTSSGTCECFEGFESWKLVTFEEHCHVSSSLKTFSYVLIGVFNMVTVFHTLLRLSGRGGSSYFRNASRAAAVQGICTTIFFFVLSSSRSVSIGLLAVLYTGFVFVIYMSCLIVMGLLQPIFRITRQRFKWFHKRYVKLLLAYEILFHIVLLLVLIIYNGSSEFEQVFVISFRLVCSNMILVSIAILFVLHYFTTYLTKVLRRHLDTTPLKHSDAYARTSRLYKRLYVLRGLNLFVNFCIAILIVCNVLFHQFGYHLPEEVYLVCFFFSPLITFSPTVLLVTQAPGTQFKSYRVPRIFRIRNLDTFSSASNQQLHVNRQNITNTPRADTDNQEHQTLPTTEVYSSQVSPNS